MHVPTPYPVSFRILRRDGHAYHYESLDAACADLVAGGFYRHGMLSNDIVETFASLPAEPGLPAVPLGTHAVETLDGRRLSRDEVRSACAGLGRRRRRTPSRWHRRPARRHRVTRADRREAIAHRQDLADLGFHPGALVAPLPGLDDPYEHHPRRRPERSWKRHRATRWR